MAKVNLKDALNTSLTKTKAYIDAELAKKANASHGTHVTYGGNGSASTVSRSDHTHNYAGSSSAGGAATSANKVNTNLAIKLNGGTTEGTNLFTFNGSAAKTVNITPNAIGAAASSHGTHVSYGGNGSATTVSRSDHTHNHLEIKGTNTITSTTDDTTANWGAQKTSIHWYTTTGQLTDQPGQWGYILNVGKDSEVHQLWMTQASGDLKHRGGNSNGWSGTWRTLLDTTNFKTHVTPSAIGAAASSHGTHLTLGTTSSTAYRGDYGNTAYTHSQAAHAPSNAQKNSDITKAEIEAKLTGTITSHTHSITDLGGAPIVFTTQANYDSITPNANTLYIIS